MCLAHDGATFGGKTLAHRSGQKLGKKWKSQGICSQAVNNSTHIVDGLQEIEKKDEDENKKILTVHKQIILLSFNCLMWQTQFRVSAMETSV